MNIRHCSETSVDFNCTTFRCMSEDINLQNKEIFTKHLTSYNSTVEIIQSSTVSAVRDREELREENLT
jgi:hypothetical protein